MTTIDDNKTEESVRVVAPFDFEEGYEFDTTVTLEDGQKKIVQVSVPAGGVKEGDVITVTPDKVTKVEAKPSLQDITGKWRTDLCDCCAIHCFGDLFCAFWLMIIWSILCCIPNFIFAGQLFQRLKLGDCCKPSEDYGKTCRKVVDYYALIAKITLFVDLCYAFAYFIGWADKADKEAVDRVHKLMLFALGLQNIQIFIALMIVRYRLRKKHSIPASCKCCSADDSCCDDIICICCCNSLSTLQMIRHTHDEKEHPYKLFSPTGLSDDTPLIALVV